MGENRIGLRAGARSFDRKAARTIGFGGNLSARGDTTRKQSGRFAKGLLGSAEKRENVSAIARKACKVARSVLAEIVAILPPKSKPTSSSSSSSSSPAQSTAPP